MLTGHIAVAMGAHGLRRTVPLWLLVLASQAPDWADAVVCSTGLRPPVVGMYSHSIPATALIAAIAGIVALGVTREAAAAALTAAVVLAHTAGDYLTGIKPTWPGGPLVGARLYTQPALDFLLEGMVLIVCFLLYRRSFTPERRYDRRVYTLPLVLILIQAAADILLALTPSIEKC
jgi:hypothetical protein